MNRLAIVTALIVSTFVPAAVPSRALADEAAGTVRVDLDPTRLLVGDRVAALLAAPCPASGAQPTFPDWSKGWGDAEVLVAGPVTIERRGAECAAVQRLELTAFEVGSVALPTVSVRLSDGTELRTPPDLALEVRSVLAADDQELEPAPPAPPRRMPVPRSAWFALAGGALLAALAGLLAWRRRYGTDALAAPALAPFAELERAFGLLGERSPEEAFRGLSRAFRRYLGRTFDFHALESSSTEIQKRLGERKVPRELVQRSASTLRLADQVKFARRPARADEAAQRIDETRQLAVELEARLAPPPGIEANEPAEASPARERTVA